MSNHLFNYKQGDQLAIKRDKVCNNKKEVVIEEGIGTIKLGYSSDGFEGGEGKVYCLDALTASDIDVDYTDQFVAKIYHNKEIADGKKDKILHMLTMLQFLNDANVDANLFENVCWPYYAIYDGDVFVGYIMPKATGVLLRKVFYPDIKDHFKDFTRKDLINICLNIIDKINKFHKVNIIIADIHPENYILSSPDKIFYIDTDSYQFDNYYCKVEKHEYTAPELRENNDYKQTLSTEGYSFAIVIFKILMLGKGPFTCRDKEELEIEERMVKGLFPYSLDNKKTKELAPNILYYNIWSYFPIELKLLFINLFTRAKKLKSVDDFTKPLKIYLKFIEDNNFLDLLPTKEYIKDKNEIVEQEKLIQQEKARKVVEAKQIEQEKESKAIEAKKIQQEKVKENKEEKAIKKYGDSIVNLKQSLIENNIKKYSDMMVLFPTDKEIDEFINIFNSYIPNKLSEKMSLEDDLHTYKITYSPLEIEIIEKAQSNSNLKSSAWKNFLIEVSKKLYIIENQKEKPVVEVNNGNANAKNSKESNIQKVVENKEDCIKISYNVQNSLKIMNIQKFNSGKFPTIDEINNFRRIIKNIFKDKFKENFRMLEGKKWEYSIICEYLGNFYNVQYDFSAAKKIVWQKVLMKLSQILLNLNGEIYEKAIIKEPENNNTKVMKNNNDSPKISSFVKASLKNLNIEMFNNDDVFPTTDEINKYRKIISEIVNGNLKENFKKLVNDQWEYSIVCDDLNISCNVQGEFSLVKKIAWKKFLKKLSQIISNLNGETSKKNITAVKTIKSDENEIDIIDPNVKNIIKTIGKHKNFLQNIPDCASRILNDLASHDIINLKTCCFNGNYYAKTQIATEIINSYLRNPLEIIITKNQTIYVYKIKCSDLNIVVSANSVEEYAAKKHSWHLFIKKLNAKTGSKNKKNKK